MQIAIALYDGLTALDAIGPYEVLSKLPGADVVFVAESAGECRADTGVLGLVADKSFAEVTAPGVIVVPGGAGSRDERTDALVEWVREVHPRTTYTTSVCTGSLVLARAGVLDGRPATSHWLFLDHLRELGAKPVQERVVRDGKIFTAAGVSAGIDMALELIAEIAGPEVAQCVQLAIEYDPQPPFDSGSPQKAPPEIVETVTRAHRQA